MTLICSLFGHKWRNRTCTRCGKEQTVQSKDIEIKEIETEDILPTGRTFEEQVKHDLQNVIESEKRSINPKFHRTEREEDLSFNFSQKWASAIQKYEDDIYSETAKVGTLNSVDDNIEQCHKAIAAFEAFRNYCYKKSKGGQIYFDDMWEHCHNSKNHCFSYIQSTKDYLNELTENYDAYKVRFEKESQLDKILLDIISNDNGISQRKLYPLIPEVPQASIRKAVDELVKAGKVIKEKKGSSYTLWLAEGEAN
ncbi:hypothetical protein JCM15765_02240 [Paradesulfitobacterium aromaticivorans]